MMQSAATPRQTDHPTRRWPLALLLVAVLFGAGVGGLLTWHHERELYGDASMQDGLVGCEESATVNCDIVNTSDHSELLGVPIATLGIPVYLLAALLAASALRGQRRALPVLAVLGLFATGYAAFLLYVSVVQLGTVCAWCMRLYGVNVAMLVLPLLAGALRAPRPGLRHIGLYAVTLLLLGTVAIAGQRLHRIVLLGVVPPELSSVVTTPLPERIDLAPAEDPEGLPDVTEVAIVGDDGAKVLPITAEDPWRGNPAARVTVVEFADLQCGYCKRAAGQLDRLFAAYGDRALFVFKHFPMDPACNPGVTNRLHARACLASKAAVCAQQQGRFWDYQHLAFKSQHALDADSLRVYADRVGLNLSTYDACMRSPEPLAAIQHHGEQGAAVGVHGTPRIYIDGTLYRSGSSAEQMAIAIEVALGASEERARELATALHEAPVEVEAVPEDAPPLREIAIGSMKFRMFTFEGALSQDGRATSGKRQIPGTNMSWYAARDACGKAGLRLCTEKEWVAVCQGDEPVDDNGNGQFADDIVEGTSYPYGDYHDRGRCWDGHEGDSFRPVYTGEMPGCVSATGVYDLTGNVEEWVGVTEETAILLGGAFDTPKDKARCYRRNDTFGAGFANKRTGFRCCAD